jgi:hypothetical protein
MKIFEIHALTTNEILSDKLHTQAKALAGK